MTLSKRAALLIFPVIFTGYALAALYVYQLQSVSLKNLEQAKLDNRISSLKLVFSNYSNYLNGFLVSIQQSDKLRSFLSERDDRYRSSALGLGLEELVKAYQQNTLEFISFAVMSADLELIYYYENSRDPFSKIPSEQFEFAENIFSEKKLTDWSLYQNGNSSTIVQSMLIDDRTLTRPLPTHLDNSVLLLATIEPSDFDQLMQEVKNDYFMEASISSSAHQNPDELYSEAEIFPGYFLSLQFSREHLKRLDMRLKAGLILSVLMSSIITFLVLQFLIKKFITRPIAELDEQLNLVLAGQKDNVSNSNRRDEVSRLGAKFHNLFNEMSMILADTKKMSRTDALTGLSNRVALYEFAQRMLEQAKNKKNTLHFIYIDLDNFKFVNDKYGHDIGDELLKAFVNKLVHLIKIVKSEDVLIEFARLSGDEFIIVASGMDDLAIVSFAEKMKHIFSGGFSFERGSFPVTISLGIASYPEDGHGISQLISNSDIAMYQAKSAGKNRYDFYSKSLAESSRRKADIETQLKALNCDEEFSLVYMPIKDAANITVGCEVLLRWESPLLGYVPPNEFIPIAESTGLFEKVDFWVIKNSLKSMPQLKALFGDEFVLSINISSAQLSTDRIHHFILEMLDKYGIDPENVELEITETFGVEQTDKVLQLLKNIQSSGVKIAIDDFGTGFTSIMQMIDYPVDKVKLDKSFIDRVTGQHRTEVISAIINLCHLQGLKVTAEGIESEAQKRELLKAGCDYLQGYYFSKPVTMEQLADNGTV